MKDEPPRSVICLFYIFCIIASITSHNNTFNTFLWFVNTILYQSRLLALLSVTETKEPYIWLQFSETTGLRELKPFVFACGFFGRFPINVSGGLFAHNKNITDMVTKFIYAWMMKRSYVGVSENNPTIGSLDKSIDPSSSFVP